MTPSHSLHWITLGMRALALGLLMGGASAQEPTPKATPPDAASLLLDPTTFYLPKATLGKPYTRTLKGQGGQAPYAYQLATGPLPEGFALSPAGVLAGTPTKTGTWRFTATVTDTAKQSARQTYTLRVEKPPPPAPPPTPRRPWDGTFVFYRLDPDTLKVLLPPPPLEEGQEASTPEPPQPPITLYEDQAKVISDSLQAMVGMECPERHQFEAALRFRWPAQVPDLRPESQAQLRQWLTDQSQRSRALNLPMTFRAIQPHGDWGEITGEIYAFHHPDWQATAPPQAPPVDLSVIWGMGYVALPIQDSGDLGLPANWGSREHHASVRSLQPVGTRLDLTLFRGDWSHLQGLSVEQITERAQLTARRAMALVDTPLTDFLSRVQDFLVGYTTERPCLAGGLTLYLRPPTALDLQEPFRIYTRQLIFETARIMRKSSRTYTLNLVVPDLKALSTGAGCGFDMQTLLGYLEPTENIQADRATFNGPQPSSTNVNMRFLVMLWEPTHESKRELRTLLADNPSIAGGMRRIVMHKVIPVISGWINPKDSAELKRFNSDMAYFADAFGGVAFWTVPADSGPLRDGVLWAFDKDSKTWLPKVRDWVGTYRWELRIAFQGITLLLLIALALALNIACTHHLKRQHWLAFLGVGTLVLALGALLLNFDPDLKALREGNALLLGLIVLLVIAALVAVFKPRILKP